MKLILVAFLCALAALPLAASAQETVPTGNIPRVADNGPYLWAIAGHEIINVRASSGDYNPYMRCSLYDARTVEILSRVQAPPLSASDIRVVTKGARTIIGVRRFLLLDIIPQDAKAEGTSLSSVAQKWVSSVRKALPDIAPKPSRFGV